MSQITDLFELKGLVAVVTGASSGIGLEISKILALLNASVVLLARRSDLLEQEVKKIQQEGGRAASIAVDLLDQQQLEASQQKICEIFGAPDIVVNAAGVNFRDAAEAVSWENWEKTVGLNLSAPFFFTRPFVKSMKSRQWGRVINVASLQSVRAFANGIAYGASKGGVVQLTRAMAEEWSKYGITCNAIAPGFFETALTAPVFDSPEIMERVANQTAMGRNGEMSDLHGPIAFLASRASDYVTGQTLFVDGGFTAK